ncbi:hypothetical protein [Leisingera sp. ANG-Vp]|uniref:hypothetical protein n=1 Tax=Leisingera sp. ANG-Vp TaxID=1577896 RepID=UPI00057DB0EA|nr:hypothetical protein [Leisingera sp. ANG-Vp]KIC14065.1 hypothetical protein RA20_21590 [Leisingera sp. ANG-Vp]
MLTLEHNGKTYANWTAADLAAAGVPQQVIDAVPAQMRLKKIKAECRRRIYEAQSAESQMNMATAAAVISGKAVDARTAEEAGILDGVGQALDWVTAMRNAVDVLAADPASDYLADAAWPPLPAAVQNVVALY